MEVGVESGGILSLSKFARDHRGALEYDLMTRTGCELEDVGRSLSWGALGNFIKNLPLESATVRELKPEMSLWSTRFETNVILADIFDVLQIINANLVAYCNRHRAEKPPRYPRPFQKKNDDKTHIGSGALPPAELRAWFEKKRRLHHERND